MSDLTYPRHVHRRGGVYFVVETAEQYTAALADGWMDRPDPSWPPVPDGYREWRIGDPAPDMAPTPERKKPGPKPKAGPKPSES